MKNRRSFVLIAIFIATFMASVEATIVTTAMPTIISDLHGLAIQSWVFAVYLLATAIITPIGGKLSDRIGRKPIFMIGLIFFTLGSFLCGLAPNMMMLIIFRLIQGIGAGALLPITFTIIADLYTFSERPRIIALINTAWGISGLGGPLLGGYIVQVLNWHWVFFVNVPLGIIVFLLVLFAYHEQKREAKSQPIDFAGIFFLALTLISLLLIFQELGNSTINWTFEIITIIVFILSTLFFIRIERKAADPLIRLDLFKNRMFTIQIATVLLLSGALIGFMIYFPIWLQSIYRVPALVAGLAITPSPILWMSASFFVGFLMRKFVPKFLFLTIIAIIILIYIPIVFSSSNFPMFIFYIIAALTGGGLGIIVTMNTLLAQRLVPKDSIGVASSMVVLGRTIGQAILTGVYGLLFSLGIQHQLKKFPSINENMMNQFISSGSHQTVSNVQKLAMNQITLSALHDVFWLVIVIYAAAFLLNLMDKNKEIIK